ncbi:MAG: PspC domain-containing protein [Bacteroidales bacterium]|nr:PspC domain-containing protein [Bacteroidales bacterium]
MNKTIKINLGGVLFQIDEEAYSILRGYLNEIDNRIGRIPGGAETIEDIEARIAEIFQSQGATAGVISKDNVEAMIKIIGRPEDFEAGGEADDRQKAYSRARHRKNLFRNPDDSIIGGVCGGMGIYLDIDPVWIRVLFAIFAFFAGVGLLIYLALWIALPSANTEAMKKEMYGTDPISPGYGLNEKSLSFSADAGQQQSTGSGRLGNALNEIFRAIGKVFFIALRVFLVLLGLAFVLTGFLTLVSIIMVFFFKYPGYFSTHACDMNLFYLPDFLNYVVNPAVAPWIIALAFVVLLMPLLAIIYWGIKMIIWFRAKDMLFSLAGFIIWVIAVAALSILLFNEGISYAETAKTGTEEVLQKTKGDIYIFGGNKLKDLKYDKEISFPDEDYNIYFTDDNRSLFISPSLRINSSNDEYVKINVRKRSSGRSRLNAAEKVEQLVYNYSVMGDTIFLDEYFTIPDERKWSFDNVVVNLYIPEGTIVHFTPDTEKLFRQYHYGDDDCCWDISDRTKKVEFEKHQHEWVMTEDGLRKE